MSGNRVAETLEKKKRTSLYTFSSEDEHLKELRFTLPLMCMLIRCGLPSMRCITIKLYLLQQCAERNLTNNWQRFPQITNVRFHIWMAKTFISFFFCKLLFPMFGFRVLLSPPPKMRNATPSIQISRPRQQEEKCKSCRLSSRALTNHVSFPTPARPAPPCRLFVVVASCNYGRHFIPTCFNKTHSFCSSPTAGGGWSHEVWVTAGVGFIPRAKA